MTLGDLFDKLKALESQRQDIFALKSQMVELQGEEGENSWALSILRTKLDHAETIYRIMRSEDIVYP